MIKTQVPEAKKPETKNHTQSSGQSVPENTVGVDLSVKSNETQDFSKETVRFEWRLVAVMLVFLMLIGAVVFAESYKNEKTLDSETSNQATQQSEFRGMLANVIQDLSYEDGLQYALDERYYNEQDIKTYIAIMTDKGFDYITSNDLKQYFWNLFMPVKNNFTVGLIKKDNETLIFECTDREKMNRLDRAYMGIVNNDVIKVSKGFYLSQNNDDFALLSYGTSNVKKSGCGLVSLTMGINYVCEKNVVSLNDVLKWADENNMYQENVGTKWSLIRNFPHTVSVNCDEMHINNIDKFNTTLAEGEVLITSMGTGHFTNNGHFIVITEIKDGMVSVLDPASICRTLKKWDAQLVFEESNKCFWKISKPQT